MAAKVRSGMVTSSGTDDEDIVTAEPTPVEKLAADIATAESNLDVLEQANAELVRDPQCFATLEAEFVRQVELYGVTDKARVNLVKHLMEAVNEFAVNFNSDIGG